MLKMSSRPDLVAQLSADKSSLPAHCTGGAPGGAPQPRRSHSCNTRISKLAHLSHRDFSLFDTRKYKNQYVRKILPESSILTPSNAPIIDDAHPSAALLWSILQSTPIQLSKMADHNYKFNVTMTCGGCSRAVENVLGKLAGVPPLSLSPVSLPFTTFLTPRAQA